MSAKLCCCGAGAVPLQSHEIVSQRDRHRIVIITIIIWWQWWWSLCFIKFVYDCRITNCRKNAEFVNWLCVCVCVVDGLGGYCEQSAVVAATNNESSSSSAEQTILHIHHGHDCNCSECLQYNNSTNKNNSPIAWKGRQCGLSKWRTVIPSASQSASSGKG